MILADAEIVINVVAMLVFGIICAAIASGRGRSGVGWFFIGFLTQCIGLILVLVLPDLKQEEQRHRRQRNETRKLREQLMKERQIADQRHEQVERRLDVHDASLGLDTSLPPELPAATAPAAQLSDGGIWFYASDNRRQGPVSEGEIRRLLGAGVLTAGSLVWCDGMEDWAPVEDVGAFRGDVG